MVTESKLGSALRAKEDGEIDTAIKLFDGFLGEENPKHCVALTELATLLSFTERYDDAFPIFETALAHCKVSERAAPLHNYASALLRQTRGDDAATEAIAPDATRLLEECRKISPTNEKCQQKLASIER
jgi:hypothetical protein